MLQEEWVKNMSDTTYEEIIKKGLSKRHAKEKRLKVYGILSILFALSLNIIH